MDNSYQTRSMEHSVQAVLPDTIQEVHNFPEKPEFLILRHKTENDSELKVIKALEQSLLAPLLCRISMPEDEIDFPLGFVPVPTGYGSIIINGIERAPVLKLEKSPGLYLEERQSSRLALLVSESRRQLRLNYSPTENNCIIQFYASEGNKRRNLRKINISLEGINDSQKARDIIMERMKSKDAWEDLENIIHVFNAGSEAKKQWNENSTAKTASEYLETDDIISLMLMLAEEEKFNRLFPECSMHDLQKLRTGLLGNYLTPPVRRIFADLKTDSLREIESALTGCFPRSSKLYNPFYKLSDGSIFPVLNRLNPLAVLSDLRKIKKESVGPGVFQIPREARDVNESHKMKICPIETPESEDIGLTLFLAKNAGVEAETGMITMGNSILGYSASLIPFIGHNEGARAIMGAKNMKQSLLLEHNEPPLVKTGTEKEIGDFASGLNCSYQAEFVSEGLLSLGRNLLTAYMPYHGLNFEDAVVISDKLLKDDLLTSVHYHELTTDVYADESPAIIRSKGKHVSEGDIWCIISTGSKELNDCRVSKGVNGIICDIIKISSAGRVLQENEDFPFREPQDPNRKIGIIKVIVKELKKVRLGDKLTGRHGNKGVIGAIIPEENMPHLPDGSAVEIILNPHGVLSRMNLGQLLETHYALLYKHKDRLYDNKEALFSPEEKTIIGQAGKAFQKHDSEKLKVMLKKLLDALFPEENITFHSDGKVILRDGRTGKLYENPSVIGYQYFFKLDHLSEKKISVRSSGLKNDYCMITGQPLKGKNNNGGQKIGEMEYSILFNHDVPDIINESLRTRSEFGIENGVLPKATKALFNYLRGMMIEPVLKSTDKETLFKISIDGKMDSFTLQYLNTDSLVEDSSEITDPNTYLFTRIYNYSCPDKQCKEQSTVKVESDLQNAPLNRLYVKDLVTNGPRKLKCPYCRDNIYIKSIKPGKAKLKCTCGKLDNLRTVTFSLSTDDPRWLCCPCGEKLERQKRSAFGFKHNENGIMSEEIFSTGISNGERFGYIKLNAEVDHPFLEGKKISILPVIPPHLRPQGLNMKSLKPEGDYINRAYNRIIRLNNRLAEGIKASEKADITKDVEDSIRELMTSGNPKNKSLLGYIKGKNGIIRNSIFGKREDFSARAVIIPAPEIRLDECKLSLPILKKFFGEDIKNECGGQYPQDEMTLKEAITKIIKKSQPVVLLNRQPSLHKYNILSFHISEDFYDDPVIGIHPLVLSGFGADHDGDTIAVHLLLNGRAKAEADKILPSQNIISDATGEPVLHFDQDIISGLDCLLESNDGQEYFWSMVKNITGGEFSDNIRRNSIWRNSNTKGKIRFLLKKAYRHFNSAVCARVAEELMKAGFDSATRSALSISFSDLESLKTKLSKDRLDKDKITSLEVAIRYEDEILKEVESLLSKSPASNPAVRFVTSGARGNPDQVMQMIGIKGLAYIKRWTFKQEFFIESCFLDGLSEEEYFYSAFRSRDVMMDKKLMAPVTGTILRQLTWALMNVVITEKDCGTRIKDRSPFMCRSLNGVCQLCYGPKPLNDELRTGDELYPIGTKIGLIAAQSIGERSSQTAMKRVHHIKQNIQDDDICILKSLLTIRLPQSRDEAVKYMEDYYLPEQNFTKIFQGLDTFSQIDSRHFSVLLRSLIDMDNADKDKLIESSDGKLKELLTELIQKRGIRVFNLRDIIEQGSFLSVFGYSQLVKLLKREIQTGNESIVSGIKDRLYKGVY